MMFLDNVKVTKEYGLTEEMFGKLGLNEVEE